MENQDSIMNKCFVCQKITDQSDMEINSRVHLPECKECKGSEAEKDAEKDALDSLAEGFVCGCI
ncbi:MAG: hypothetical protein ACOC10_11230 [Bacteroidota bacterium]